MQALSDGSGTNRHYKRALTIAGSDSGGGAGIQADLKTFSALGCYGMSVVTALTAQNTTGVTGIHAVPPDFVVQQMAAVFSDIGADAVKIGMLYSAELIQAVADGLGAVPIGAFVDADVQSVLALPADHEPLYLVPVGHPETGGVP